MTQSNGGAKSSFLDPSSEACIELLESVLASAKRGEFHSVAVVAVGPNDFGASFAGPDAARLNLGLDTAKAAILAAVNQPAPKKQSHIIQARR